MMSVKIQQVERRIRMKHMALELVLQLPQLGHDLMCTNALMLGRDLQLKVRAGA
jgi:hypothetical protein